MIRRRAYPFSRAGISIWYYYMHFNVDHFGPFHRRYEGLKLAKLARLLDRANYPNPFTRK